MDFVTPTGPSRPARLVAVAVTLAEVLALVGFSVLFAVETALGASGQPTRAVMSIVLMLAFAAALAYLAKTLWHRPEAARTPAVVWNALLVPVAWGLFQSGQTLIGAVVLGCALIAIAAAILAARGS